jgi:uncharacterized protein (DUF1499 family)
VNMKSEMSRKGAAAGLVVIGSLVAVASVAVMLLGGIGYRMQWWHFRTGITLLRWAFWFAAAGGMVALIGLVLAWRQSRKLSAIAMIGVLVGAAGAYVPWSYKRLADSLPYIHDISTDTANPPVFVAAAKIRKEGDHPVEYDGPEVAAQQRAAYPDLVSMVILAPSDRVFELAKKVVTDMGMNLVEANAAEGRIEANSTSLLFGFTDDMVVRIVPNSGGSTVDVRSKSRVGRSDVGQNAKRIRIFMRKLQDELD